MGWSFHWGAWNNRGSEGVRAWAENGVRRRKACVGRAWGVRGVCVGCAWDGMRVQCSVRCGARGRAVQGVRGVVWCEGSCGARGARGRVSAAAAHLARLGLLLRAEVVLGGHVETQLREGRLVKVGI